MDLSILYFKGSILINSNKHVLLSPKTVFILENTFLVHTCTLKKCRIVRPFIRAFTVCWSTCLQVSRMKRIIFICMLIVWIQIRLLHKKQSYLVPHFTLVRMAVKSLPLCLLMTTFVVCWSLQTVSTQIRPNTMLGLIRSQAVWHWWYSLDILLNPGMTHSFTLHSSWMQCNRMGHAWVTEDVRENFLKKSFLKQICRRQKSMHLPSMWRFKYIIYKYIYCKFGNVRENFIFAKL